MISLHERSRTAALSMLVWVPVALAALPAAAGDAPHPAPSYSESDTDATSSATSPRISAFTRASRDCTTLFVGGISFPGNTRGGPIPNTSLTFHQGGDVAAPVIVEFVASWPRPTDQETVGSDPTGPIGTRTGVNIALLVDGQRADIASDQGDIPAVFVHDGSTQSPSNGTRGFTFVTRPVAPGDHTLSLLWSPVPLSATYASVCIAERSLVVHHR